MNHPSAQNPRNASTVASSISSVLLSIIASSHHWLHMGLLFLLGGSAGMVSMSDILRIRRFMIAATVLTALFTLYRLLKHKHMPVWTKAISVLSIAVSLGFVVYTLTQFGW